MKRHSVVKILVVTGVFLMFRGFKPVSQNAMLLETNEASMAPVVVENQFQPPAAITPIHRPDLTEPPQKLPQVPTRNWHEQLLALHGIGKLFGPEGEARMKLLQDFVEGLDITNVPAAVKELQELQTQSPTETGRDLRLRLLQKWGQSDIRSAANWVTKTLIGSDCQEAVATMAGEWAGQNFTEAKAWASQLSDVNERQSALESVADSAVYTDPLNALNLASTLPASSERDSMITRSVGVWARNSPDDAIAWAKQILDERLQEQAIANIAVSWSEKDPMAAATLAANSLQAGSLQDKTVIGIVQRWGLTDISGAKAWVNQFPEGSLRESAISALNRSSYSDHSSMLLGSQ